MSGAIISSEPTSLRSEVGQSHILALDALRGFSALLVLAAHLHVAPFDFGYVGVSIFFAISGFLITWLLLRENDTTGTVSLKAFYARRTLRIFPAFYVYWALCILVSRRVQTTMDWREVWFSFFYMGDYYYGFFRFPWRTGASILGVTWSLGVEEKFYLIWPTIFKRLHLKPESLCRLLIGSITGILVYRILSWYYVKPSADYFRYAFEMRLDNIAFGCLIAISVHEGYAPKLIRVLTARAGYPLIALAALAGSWSLNRALGPGYFFTLGLTLNSAFITVLLIQLVILARTQLKWLELRPLRWLGRISYSLYLYHPTVIVLMSHYLPNLRWRWYLVCTTAASILVAAGSYEMIEKPFLRLKERFTVKKRSPLVALRPI